MSLIKLSGINDIKEAQVAPEGLYDLVVLKADEKHGDEGKVNIRLLLGFENVDEDYATIFHYISLPTEGDDSEKVRMKLLMAKRFFHQFDIDVEGETLDLSDLVGARASEVKVVQEEYEGRVNNKIQLASLPSED